MEEFQSGPNEMQFQTPEKRTSIWLKMILWLVFACVVGGLTYYFVNKRATTDKNNLQSQIDDLNTKISAAATQGDSSLLTTLCQSSHPGLTCVVGKIDGNYATGASSGTEEGSNWYAKKTGNTWAMTVDNLQDVPACSMVTDFPKTIVPSCGQ